MLSSDANCNYLNFQHYYLHSIADIKSYLSIEFYLILPKGDLIGIRDRTILELLYASAIRRSELARLRFFQN